MRNDHLLPFYSPLLNDFYQFTMSYGYFQLGMHDHEACFHLLFRKNPFKSHYALSCGLESALHFMQHWKFNQDDLDYLSSIKNERGKPYFSKAFTDYLQQLKLTIDVEAVPEGQLVFANAPLLRIQGPLLQCQLLESPLLNIINFQTLIATKASRICQAAGNQPVIEFGMRRAQGPDGALSASRAAYIGGCTATSNTLAGKYYDIPVKGTHAHSWVSAFPNEQQAFDAYASIMPHNSVLLVDTYNTLEGVKHAIKTGLQLKKEGAKLQGIRLDSGDMATLSSKARHLLDEAGFENTQILASNSLDEYTIADLKAKGAHISAWGVGTSLATAYDQPALDGVYKLSALKNAQGQWEYKLKLSEEKIKTSNPGRHQIRRFYKKGLPALDVIYDLEIGMNEHSKAVDIANTHQIYSLDEYDHFTDLLIPILKKGKRVADEISIHDLRKQALQTCVLLPECEREKRFPYPIALEQQLADLKQELVREMKGKAE